jgi:hypothetical protein
MLRSVDNSFNFLGLHFGSATILNNALENLNPKNEEKNKYL